MTEYLWSESCHRHCLPNTLRRDAKIQQRDHNALSTVKFAWFRHSPSATRSSSLCLTASHYILTINLFLEYWVYFWKIHTCSEPDFGTSPAQHWFCCRFCSWFPAQLYGDEASTRGQHFGHASWHQSWKWLLVSAALPFYASLRLLWNYSKLEARHIQVRNAKSTKKKVQSI